MTAFGGVDGEMLSAYLDDEVSPAEREMVEAALGASAEARAELEALRGARQLLRDLPRLEPPPELRPLLRRPARRPRRIAVLAAGAAVTVLAWSVLISKDAVPGVDVPVAEAVELHQAAEQSDAGPAQPRWAPVLPGYDLTEETRQWDMRVAHYRSTTGSLSLFVRSGHVRWDRLPEGGTRAEVDGDTAWTGTIEGYAVTVVERDGRVLVVVSDEPGHDVEVTKDLDMPSSDSSPSLWNRLGNGCHETIEVLSLGA